MAEDGTSESHLEIEEDQSSRIAASEELVSTQIPEQAVADRDRTDDCANNDGNDESQIAPDNAATVAEMVSTMDIADTPSMPGLRDTVEHDPVIIDGTLDSKLSLPGVSPSSMGLLAPAAAGFSDGGSLQADFEDSLGLPEPDYDHLGGAYDHDQEPVGEKPQKKAPFDKATGPEKPCVDPHYILGTLIVRVVAARDLESVKNGGLGDFLFGGGRSRSRKNFGGTANPYASVKFGGSTQRTSEVYDTLDPIWPRGETMYMDVSLPLSKCFHQESDNDSDSELLKPILTVALFHASEIGGVHKYPSKGSSGDISGDSDDFFLGMAAIDVTPLLTGKRNMFDEWIPLAGSENSCGSVRVVCEYDASDSAPMPGDSVRFTKFCHPTDLYPVPPARVYHVQETEGDCVLLSYRSPEGWLCTFVAHRFMLVCEERHHGAMEVAREELASLTERFLYSPMASSVTETVTRLPDEGIVTVGADLVANSVNLVTRWLERGPGTALEDIVNATNFDGRFNPDTSARLSTSLDTEEESQNDVASNASTSIDVVKPTIEAIPLPNMPECPITGEPMIDPVVAADGHTYERNGIARWLLTSDKSPLTGSVLPHKELVPNYGLLSSLQDAAGRMQENGKSAVASSEVET